MHWIVVVIVQLVVAWFAVRYVPKPGLTADNFYFVYAVLSGIAVWLVGLGLSFASKDSRPTILQLGGSVAIALLVAVFIQFDRYLGLNDLLYYVLPGFGARQTLILMCAASGYWAADDLTKLPFNPVFLPSLVVAIFGAVLGALAGGAILHLMLAPGTYPRFLLAIPILAGGAMGLLAGAGLVVGVAFLFRRRTPAA